MDAADEEVIELIRPKFELTEFSLSFIGTLGGGVGYTLSNENPIDYRYA